MEPRFTSHKLNRTEPLIIVRLSAVMYFFYNLYFVKKTGDRYRQKTKTNNTQIAKKIAKCQSSRLQSMPKKIT